MFRAQEYQPRPGSPLGAIVAQVYPRYQALLQKSNAVDFDDLLLHIATLLRESPEVRAELDARYRYVMIDEYQDTNLAQYTIARALSFDHPNLAVTGDPDQSIYGWRGANLGNILDFERDYPDVHVVRLEQNYRSTKAILRVADRLIGYNQRRKEKRLFTENDEGAPVRLMTYATNKDEADDIAAQIATMIDSGRRRPRDIAVFYRVNALSRALEFALKDHSVPYQMVHGFEFYQRAEIKDVLGYLMLLNNPRDDVAFQRVVNRPARAIGKTTLDRLTEHANRYGLTLLEAAREAGLIESLGKKAPVNVAKFVSLFDRLSLLACKPVEEIIGHVLTDSGYKQALIDSESEEDQERLANIEELLTAAREFDEQHPGDGHLEEFLEQVCLVNDTDDWESDGDRVTLMTMHAAKGLEFPVVFIMAVEQGLLPHERSQGSADELEEERRLLFVGITRAEEELQLSLVKFREFRGQRKYVVPSQFLFELPREELDTGEHGQLLGDLEGVDEREWEEPSFDITEETPPAPRSATPQFGSIRLTTAAQLAGHASESDEGDATETFAQGMLVSHPEYGVGKIVALSGSRSQRKATIEFLGNHMQRTFVLAASPLRPIASGNP